MTYSLTELQETIETRHQVHPADLDCYDTPVIQEVQYLTDPLVKAGQPSYRFYAELVHKSENKPVILVDIVTINPSQVALNRVVRQSSFGPEYCVSRFWSPVPDALEPF